MIDDGYTQQWNGFWYRPLGPEGRDEVRRIAWTENALVEWLWRPPRFWGPWTDPSEDEQKELFRRMMESDTEEDDARNLKESVRILLTNPMLGRRTCAMCRHWWFDQDTGYIAENSEGPITRPDYAPVSCDTSVGCAKGHHSNPRELSDRNRKAWEHFLKWRHVGLPDVERQCPIVRRNWEILGNLVEEHGLHKLRQNLAQSESAPQPGRANPQRDDDGAGRREPVPAGGVEDSGAGEPAGA